MGRFLKCGAMARQFGLWLLLELVAGGIFRDVCSPADGGDLKHPSFQFFSDLARKSTEHLKSMMFFQGEMNFAEILSLRLHLSIRFSDNITGLVKCPMKTRNNKTDG